MKIFKQMNSNEASHRHTRRLESLSVVRRTDFPSRKDSAQSPEREGEKNKPRTLEKVSLEGEW